MKKILLLTTTLLLLVACETGIKNKAEINKPVLSGIVDRTDVSRRNYTGITKKPYKKGYKKIFSNSGQPGYYLQMAVFAKNKPSKSYLQPLSQSSFKYIVLNHKDKDYVLIGPYISYNSAKNKVTSVKSRLKKHTFVVQVLRP